MKLPLHLPYNKNIKGTARKLRREMTEEESKLWYQFLRNYPVRFMRQRVVDCYIVDFYCAQCKLAVELDGNQHYTETGMGQDEARTKRLNSYGISVLRLPNERVRNDFSSACKEIDEKVKQLIMTKTC